MSLDLFISPDPCKHCGRGEDRLEFNCTYNLSPMWYAIFPGDDGMVQIDGLTGQEAIHKILTAINEMTDREEEMRELEPENGWGSYDEFLSFLRNLAEACIKYPNSKWSSWR